MEISWLGHSCFRLRGREAAIVTDPCPKSTGYSIGRPAATAVTISHDHPDHSNVAAVTGDPHVVKGPGEFEIAGVLIMGVRTYHDDTQGSELGRNTAYVLEIDDVRICHLGDLGHVPTPEQVEELSGVDVLLAPVGGGSTIDATAAAETVSLIGPKLVIPMHYKTPAAKAKLEPLDRFLKEMGADGALDERQPKLTVTKSTLPEQTKVIVLDYKGQGS
ncbi:MAG: MBL fold metallo-hydrolase [Chloroflexi bacterium]|nr:MBL fold metallo-hydrolase [Chloroflexota bacterium]